MIRIAHLVRRAAQETGLIPANDDSVPADIAAVAVRLLRQTVATLNTQNDVSFGTELYSKFVSGSVLVFKPYTIAEQAIIAGGGSVDITDRIVDIFPLAAPSVVCDGRILRKVSLPECLTHVSNEPEVFTFNVRVDQSEVIFTAPVNKQVSVICTSQIKIDDSDTGYVSIPPSYDAYLSLELGISLALYYQMEEKLLSLRAQKSAFETMVKANNTSNMPVQFDTFASINKYYNA